MPSEPTVLIHGDAWKFVDIADQIAACRTHTWRREHWQRRPALVHRFGGTVALYHGQTFDPAKIDLVPHGWSHDHCAICWWTLHDSGSDEERIGYSDECGNWVCAECYQQFLDANSNENGNA